MGEVAGVRIEVLTEDLLPAATALAGVCQVDPDRHVGYLSSAREAIETELRELEPEGLDGTVVAITDDARVVGVLGLEHDVEPPRAWWYGPLVVDDPNADTIADLLWEAARRRLPSHVEEEEFAFDERSVFLPAFAARQGFVAERPSAILSAVLPLAGPHEVSTSLTVTGLEPAELDVVARLHDRLFPGTHSTGRHALRDHPDRVVRVARLASAVVGYVAAERQADGNGYIDFVGVDEGVRGRGVGRTLVAAACDALHRDHDCAEVDLSVVADNLAARRLYARLGFVEERVLQPWRKGFTRQG